MPRTPSFNFGANRKPRAKKPKKPSTGKGRGNKSNAWRAYVSAPGHSSAPIPD